MINSLMNFPLRPSSCSLFCHQSSRCEAPSDKLQTPLPVFLPTSESWQYHNISKLAFPEHEIRNIRPLATCFKMLHSHKFSATHMPANNTTEISMPPLVTSVSSQPLFMLADGNILLQHTPCSDFFAGPSWNVACNPKSTSLPPISPSISRNLASRSTSLVLLPPYGRPTTSLENHRRVRPWRATDLPGCAP
jgi:hypothetical protein